MGIVETFLVVILSFAGGVALGGKAAVEARPVSPSGRPALTSEALECKAVCGKDRVKFFDRTTGDCECIDYRK